MYRKLVIPILALCGLLSSCTPDKAELYQQLSKIDSHVHIRTEDPGIMEHAASEGFSLISINTRSDSQEYINRQKYFARKMKGLYPDRISWLATFSMENFEEPGWAEGVIQKLQEDLDQGADGFKVWKDIGMTFRDSLGHFVFLDDPLFEPILEFMAGTGKPLVTHIGEPKNCWLPIDSMTVNNDKRYFRNNPQYHMYLHPEYPSHKRLIESRNNVLARFPELNMVGAHLGSLEWDVDEVAQCLDRYPNFAVDLAARVCHLQVQQREKVRDFCIKYQDRIIYATDFGISEGADMEERIQRLDNEWKSDWNYFATGEEMESPSLDTPFIGLDLDKKVLKKIFYSNAIHWYPGTFP